VEGKETRRAGPALRAAACVALAFAGSVAVARIARRARPCQLGTPSLVECPDGPGLPSDQVAAVFALATALGRRYPRLVLPLYTGGGAVAAARVYVGVHYGTDVVAGAAIGRSVGKWAGPPPES
jgi:membrane-associated phospholipid phosphatase